MVQVHCDFGIIVILFGAEISKVTRKKKKKHSFKSEFGTSSSPSEAFLGPFGAF
jgi:hypothetical protein